VLGGTEATINDRGTLKIVIDTLAEKQRYSTALQIGDLVNPSTDHSRKQKM
jgi:hypothetical protein